MPSLFCLVGLLILLFTPSYAATLSLPTCLWTKAGEQRHGGAECGSLAACCDMLACLLARLSA